MDQLLLTDALSELETQYAAHLIEDPDAQILNRLWQLIKDMRLELAKDPVGASMAA
ncbi:hypothetical protein [Flaviaesturariibacter amylovorans]|uniref:Anti-sigma factor n=1 Tax=Flaviaesturariibacter amylovorans TaxID=1084520 RepID=A0ABP8H519_9BACT